MKKTKLCPPTLLTASLAMLFASQVATADDTQTTDQTTDLGTLKVTAEKRLNKKTEEVTGLGKTVKTSEDFNSQQTLSVRDLVKDVPGVAVVEQGHGASSGYTIRGMDKNRVAVSVDGINQIQSYLVQKRQFGDGREGSGAINEIEIENISGMQISQGASGSESGSGALGGAVSFRTKSVGDVLAPDEKFSLFHKSAYASRDNQWLHSVGFGARLGDFDALIQYSDRKKDAPEAHKDNYDTEYQVWRWTSSTAELTNNGLDPSLLRTFVLLDECPDYKNNIKSCTPKPKVSTKPILETMSAKDYTGDKRVLGDPMDYKSGSYLAKFGLTLDPAQRLELVYENTNQRYDSRDMTKTAYHLVDKPNGGGALSSTRRIYRGNDYVESLYTNKGIGGQWTQTQFFDEEHQKDRYGLSYLYKNPTKTGLIDNTSLSFDYQKVGIDHLQIEKYCSLYPTVDRNCTAGVDKPNSAELQNRKIYTETHQLLRADFDKAIHGKLIRHQLNAGLGADRFRSNLWIGDIHDRFYKLGYKFVDYAGSTEVWNIKAPTLEHTDICKEDEKLIKEGKKPLLGEARKCGDRTITGQNLYASFKDTIYFGSVADLSLGGRYDTHKFHSNDDWTGTGNYRNWSWHTGLVVRPTDYLDIAYRASSGYRVPSFKELFGYRLDGLEKGKDDDLHYRTNAKPEKALNQEIGLSVKGGFGNVDVSYFDNRYKDLIDLTLKQDTVAGRVVNSWGYRNYQDVRLTGVSVGAKVYLDTISDKFPTGLTGRASYLKTNVKDNKINGNYYWASGYFLDTISPTRYVFGLDYASPSDKWGLGATWTVSDGKDEREIVSIIYSPPDNYNKASTKAVSSGWTTLDLSAFYRPSKHFTVRAGIYNALNYRYITWEALRQTSITSGNQHNQGLPSQYASSGRNFVLSVESKF